MLAAPQPGFHSLYFGGLPPGLMQLSHWIGATALCAVVATSFAVTFDHGSPADQTSANQISADGAPAAAPATPKAPPPPPLPESGHYVLVIEGDRSALAITAASHKAAPWAGVQKGLESAWQLSIRDAEGQELRAIPLDMSPFDLRAERQGKGPTVTGCIVLDPRVGLLVNTPCLPGAASYEPHHDGKVVGSATALAVHDLAGGGR